MVICSQCSRSLPEEPGTDLTSAGSRRFTVAHVNTYGKLCPIGGSDLSTDVCALVGGLKISGEWIDALDLGPDLAVVPDGPHQGLPGHENCRWTGGRWYPCDTRAPDWVDERD